MRLGIPLAVLAITTLMAAPASAGRAELHVSPDPPQVNQPATVSGCGFVPSVWARIYIVWNSDFKHTWTNGYSFSVTTDIAGCLAADWTPTTSGLYEILVAQLNKPGTSDPGKAKIVFEVR